LKEALNLMAQVYEIGLVYMTPGWPRKRVIAAPHTPDPPRSDI
jgi:hypothetical protein